MSAAPLPAEDDIAPSAVTPAADGEDDRADDAAPPQCAAAVGVANSSRIAATGGIRDARRAGAYADSSVTPVPSTSATITVRTDSTIEPDGNPTLSESSSARSPNASPTPPATPSALPSDADDAGLEQHRAAHLACGSRRWPAAVRARAAAAPRSS